MGWKRQLAQGSLEPRCFSPRRLELRREQQTSRPGHKTGPVETRPDPVILDQLPNRSTKRARVHTGWDARVVESRRAPPRQGLKSRIRSRFVGLLAFRA